MEVSAVLSLGIVLLFATLGGMLSVKLRLPPVAGLLIAGMLIGPNVLNLVEPNTINIFAEIGAILLLFMIGVEFSIAKILSIGLRAVVSSSLLMLMTFVIMHEAAILLNFNPITALAIAAVFSMSSTAIMVKVLEQKGFTERYEVPLLIAILIIEDIIAVFLLTFFSGLRSGSYEADEVISSVLISLGLLGFCYVVLLKLLQKFSDIFLRYQAEDTLMLFSFSLGMIMSTLASLLGLTPSIGAFLAGSIIAGLPEGKKFEDAIRPFSFLFASFFFLSIGMMIDPLNTITNAGITLVLIAIFMITVFFATVFAFFLITASGRSAIFAGLAMLPLGEFSLLIARESAGIAQINLIDVVSVGVLLTSLFCSLLLNYSDAVYTRIRWMIPLPLIRTLVNSSNYFRAVISAFEPRGYFHRLFLEEMRAVAIDILGIVCATLIFMIIKPRLDFIVTIANYSIHASILALSVLLVFCFIPLGRLFGSLRRLFDALSIIIARTTPKPTKEAILRNLLIAMALFLIFVLTPATVELLSLPRIFTLFSFVFCVLSLFFLWSALRSAALTIQIKRGKPFELLGTHIEVPKDSMIILKPKKESR
ncbi:MAG: cation:proton antiporter [Candidatus Bilamarchaeaceae archaeon]